MTKFLYKGDLPANIDFGDSIAIDTETLGLVHRRDPLCVVQISSGNGEAHIVQLDRKTYDAPVLKALLADKKVLKIFHFARFDIAAILHYLHVECSPIYCTRTASKLVRTYAEKHGLREICRELLGVELNKQCQLSDWGVETLSPEQLQYAANDVLYLHRLKDVLDGLLERENRTLLARKLFDFLPARAELDLAGWQNIDILEH